MTTGQSYVGGESHATTNDQTVNSADSTANSLTPEPITLESLLQYEGLTPESKALVSEVYSIGQRIDEVVKKFGIQIELTESDTNEAAHQKTVLAPKPKGELNATLAVNVNARFGSSEADIILWALNAYRDTQLKERFINLQNGDFEQAYAGFRDCETASGMLVELQFNTNALADRNYWASEGQQPERNEEDQQKDFKRWMNEYNVLRE